MVGGHTNHDRPAPRRYFFAPFTSKQSFGCMSSFVYSVMGTCQVMSSRRGRGGRQERTRLGDDAILEGWITHVR